MLEHLPEEIRLGLAQARKRDQRRRARLRLHVGDAIYPVLRMWEGGLALDAASAPHLRGLVDLYDGSRHLSRCLIVASVEEEGEVICEFKRATPATDRPALDFARPEDAPAGLLPST